MTAKEEQVFNRPVPVINNLTRTSESVVMIWVFLFLTPLLCNSQLLRSEKINYQWFDEITGLEHTELHNGKVYFEEHRQKNKKTKFFPKPEFVVGSVVFDGQTYFNLDLKYNVYDDALLMRVKNVFGGSILELYKPKINEFILNEQHFILVEVQKKEIVPGFYELVLTTPNFKLLERHIKKLTQKLDDTSVFYEFDDTDKTCVLYFENSYHSVKRISDLTKLFPTYSEQLTSFYKNLKNKTDFDLTLKSTLLFLDGLLNDEKTKS